MKLAPALTLLLVTGGLTSHAQERSKKEDYDLQERRGRRAEELFRRDWGASGITNSNGTTTTANYENHYNKRLNNCLEKLRSWVNKNGEDTAFTSVQIFDVNEQRTYARLDYSFSASKKSFTLLTCDVAGVQCIAEKEWEALSAHYMEE